MFKIKFSRLWTSIVVLVVILTLSFGLAFGAQAAPLNMDQLKVVSAGGYSDLSYKAETNGSVRLIVTLSEPFKAMGQMAVNEAEQHVSRISQAQADLHVSLAGHTVSHVTNYQYVPQIALTVDRAALDALVAHPSVSAIHEDIPRRHTLAQSVPLIGANTVQALGFTGAGITLAILDTGVDKTHPFLSGAVVSEACFSSNYAPHSATSVCPGGVTSSTADGSALPYAGSCPRPVGAGNGDCDHGTHVAGITAGRPYTYNTVTYTGVAPGASIIAIQVFSRFDSVSLCGGAQYTPCVMAYDSDIISGLDRVYDRRGIYNISSVNLSLGGGAYASYCDSEPEKPSIDNLKSVNIATVIASGNNSCNNYTTGCTSQISAPACISSAVSVGATTKTDAIASYSNNASFLSLLAPGSSITSSVPCVNSVCMDAWSGTSMATPHVTGTWALLKQAKPSATVDQILNALISTGLGITDTRAGAGNRVKPRIRVDQAQIMLNPCTYSISPTVSDILASGGAAGVTITVTTQAGCTWAATENLSWVNITAGSTGTGNGTVTYTATANLTGAGRTGTITVAGQTYTVQQNSNAGCTYSISPSTALAIVPTGGAGSFTVTTQAGCPWAATENLSWLNLTAPISGTGSGVVNYQVTNNTAPITRSGQVMINKLFIYVANQSGTGTSKIGVFRPATGMWYLDSDGSGGWSGCGPDSCIGPFGMAGDYPVVGDWNNTGTIKIGVFRPSTGMWYLDSDGSGGWSGCGPDSCIGPFGMAGDYPVVGDWNNTGTTKMGVFRPSTGMWYLDSDGNGGWSGCGPDGCFGQFGMAGDLPVVGHW